MLFLKTVCLTVALAKRNFNASKGGNWADDDKKYLVITYCSIIFKNLSGEFYDQAWTLNGK
jgi:hypothetical protein